MLATASKEGVPHCTIVEPSRFYEDKIIIPNKKKATNVALSFWG